MAGATRMNQQTELLINAVRNFANQEGWASSDYQIISRILQLDEIDIKGFCDKVERPRFFTVDKLQRAINRVQSQLDANDPRSQAIVSLRPLAEAGDQKLLSFLEFQEETTSDD